MEKKTVNGNPVENLSHATPRAHSMGIAEVLFLLETDQEKGITTAEAEKRLKQYGQNRIESEKRLSNLKLLVSQFTNALILILLVATVISLILGEKADSIVIIIIVIIVAALGFSQERKSARVISALRKMQGSHVSIIRDGKTIEISTEKIVPGDIVLMAAGDKVCADMRLIDSFNLLVDEAALTGESSQVLKTMHPLDVSTQVPDRTNMIYSGTAVTSGRGLAAVVSTGINTELGKIAEKVKESDTKSTSDLQQNMNEIGKKIGTIVLVVAIVVVSVALAEEYYFTGTVLVKDLFVMLLFGVALAVAAIPEALPAVITGSLAIGANKMARDKSLVRNLSAVGTLGATQVICTDKTGTLTKGEMTVTEIYTMSKTLSVSGVGYDVTGSITLTDTGKNDSLPEEMVKGMILCNDADLLRNEGNRWYVKGDTTEGALIIAAKKAGFSPDDVRESFPRSWEIPFSSDTRRMTTVHKLPSGEEVAYMKGAPESVLSKCTYILEENGVEPLNSEGSQYLMKTAETMAGRSLRVLAVSTRRMDHKTVDPLKTEMDFVFMGMVGMIDPPREEAIEAIERSKRARIRTIMITGDHKTTALTIGKQMGIFIEGDLSLTGEQLQGLDDEEYTKIVEKVSVYARVTPLDKLRIVAAWQRMDKIVVMTGDGVNDAPALKKADIGIAMGITGTEVAKEASDMILMDDNFATIIKAVAIGRTVQDNVKKYLAYLLASNLVEIVFLSLGVLLAFLLPGNALAEPLVPLLAVQILYLNLGTDGLPAVEIGISPPEPDLMDRKAEEIGKLQVFSPEVRKFIYVSLAGLIPLLFIVYLSGFPGGIVEARTRLFLSLLSIELALVLTLGSLRYPIYKVKPHKGMVISVILETVLITILIMIPYTRDALQIAYPTATDILWAISAGLISFLYIEIMKWFPGKFSRV